MNSAPQTGNVPSYPMLPLRNSVAFPGIMMPVTVGRSELVSAVEVALASEAKEIVVFTQLQTDADEPGFGDVEDIGVLCVIKRMHKHPAGIHLLLMGTKRVRRDGAVQETPHLHCQVEPLPEPEDSDSEIEALQRSMLDLAGRMLLLLPTQIQFDLEQLVAEVESPVQQAYVLCSLTSADLRKQYQLLAAATRREVLRLAVDYLGHEVQVLEVQNQISSAVQTRMSGEQREMMLRRQLHEIQEQLGENSPEQAEVAELQRRLDEARLPELVRKELERELSRLERMSSNAADYQVARSYIDLVLDLPWETSTEDNLDLDRAREILDADHFDLDEVKDRIIEHLAVMKLNPRARAPILCFVGPPGVGKTSLGQSIARALGRVFERTSLGGLHDEAELRGHRRTYVGAMPGRLVRALRRAGVNNPLLMLDEIDKLGRDFRGDPAAALLEILDPAQNAEFFDNYVDLPIDLSRVFFIATANTLDSVPAPLLDRIEVLRIAGYSEEEKIEIARRYIIGRRLGEAGLDDQALEFGDEALRFIIRNYTREAGVRSLERALGKVARKVATRVARGQRDRLAPDAAMLAEFLGPPRPALDARRESLPVGVVAGLAWTETGGEVLYVEVALLSEGTGLTLTGQLGSVMQESARAALSYIWSSAAGLGISADSFGQCGIHLHVPAGATPKDGPSAGVTMATALVSAFSGKPARADTAMTGEISLSGLVLPVGGIKEKLLAAHRAGFRRVILPAANKADLAELPQQVRNDLEFILAGKIDEVFAAAITELAVVAPGETGVSE